MTLWYTIYMSDYKFWFERLFSMLFVVSKIKTIKGMLLISLALQGPSTSALTRKPSSLTPSRYRLTVWFS